MLSCILNVLNFSFLTADIIMTLPMSGLVALDHLSPSGTIAGLCNPKVTGNGRAFGSYSLILGTYYGGIRRHSLWQRLILLVEDREPF